MASTPALARPGQEIELKLALPAGDAASLLQQLRRAPSLQRRKMQRTHLHNIYFDTPEQRLRQQQFALRLRRVGDGAATHWLQTLKAGKRDGSALSSRHEWESPVAGPSLELARIDPDVRARIDPHGTVLETLQPCFVTDFTRTVWLVHRRDGSSIEVAFDLGSVTTAGYESPICELELELKAGPVTALFDLAAEIAGKVTLLPLAISKAQRGFALAADGVDAAVIACPPELWRGMSLHDTARAVLREMFGHFTGNLIALRSNDAPEVVHQARIAWRRLRSARRLFKPVLAGNPLPDTHALAALLDVLGCVRDIDVLRHDTLPALGAAYMDQSAQRAQAWERLMQALAQEASQQRTAARTLLQDPSVGQSLLQFTRWLDAPDSPRQESDDAETLPSLRQWATRRATRLHDRLKRARRHANDPQTLHGTRLLAKQTRYSIDALRNVLPRHIAKKWYRDAADIQKNIGAERDLQQAAALLEQLQAPADIVAFIRGFAAGRLPD